MPDAAVRKVRGKVLRRPEGWNKHYQWQDANKIKRNTHLFNQKKRQETSDIGAIPPVKDKRRRGRCRKNFKLFLENYLLTHFPLKWSPHHLALFKAIEGVVLQSGCQAVILPRGSGKALAVDTPIATPVGWTSMSDLKVGDYVFDESGQPTQVIAATEVLHDRPCYAIEFTDGETIVADASHEWVVRDRWSNKGTSTLTTAQMRGREVLVTNRSWKERRYAVAMTRPLDVQHAELPIDPYTLGYWLGNGNASGGRVHCHQQDAAYVHSAIAAQTTDVADSSQNGAAISVGARTEVSLFKQIKAARLHGNKHIPAAYLRASIEQRMQLLRGIMDADGHVQKNGGCELTLKRSQLSRDVSELMSTLGIRHKITEKYVVFDGTRYGPYDRICFCCHRDWPAFAMPRKVARLREKPAAHGLTNRRYIDSIEPVESVPVRCIQVAAQSQQYLAGRKMVPTHNSTILSMACLWSAVYGHRKFLMFCPGNGDAAPEFLATITGELLQNQLLLEDFPEVAYPFVQSEGIALRANYQTSNDNPTGIKLGKFIRFPMLPENAKAGNAGIILKAKGFLGSIRGNVAHLPTGETIRPDLFLIDDPQTSASAWSITETNKRRSLLTKDIMRSAGPGLAPAAFCCATVIQKNDLADQMCESDEFAAWDVLRVSMLETWPQEKDGLWQEYAAIRKTDLREGRKDAANATQFYRKQRKKMDAGATVYWEARVDPGRISAIESAMARWIDDPAVFASEDQNQPLEESLESTDLMVRPEDVVESIAEYRRQVVPDGVTRLTAFIDISQKCLWWMVVGFDDAFRAHIVDYGVWPKQPTRHVTLSTVKLTLRQAHGGKLEEAIKAGLHELISRLMAADWRTESGEAMHIERGHVDSKWNVTTGMVRNLLWGGDWRSVWFPYEGVGIRASSRDLNDTAKKKERREVRGVHWRIVPERGGLRVIADTNNWKSFAAHRLKGGDVKLFAGDAQKHSMILDQWTAEYPIRVEGRGRIIDEWRKRINHVDEHFWDCLYNCFVIGSILGLRTEGQQSAQPTRTSKRRRSFRDRVKQKESWQ